MQILPEEFGNKRHGATQHRMASWVRRILLSRPGPLYDRLHVATLLGLTENGFAKVETIFSKALYKGVFSLDSTPRWWANEIRRILFQTVSDDASDIPQLAGRTLPAILPSDYSVCFISNSADPPPDSVAFVDATRTAERRVVACIYTMPHPDETNTSIGFETLLVLKPRKKKKA